MIVEKAQRSIWELTGFLNLCKRWLVVVALLAFWFPLVGQAGALNSDFNHKGCKQKPALDLLKAQGSQSTFFPPFPDYPGWTDGGYPTFKTFALVDYAGLTEVVNTQVNVHFYECELENSDKVERIAVFHTARALGFSQCIVDIFEVGFADAPTIFGNKAADVANGEEAAVGPANYQIRWTQDAGEAVPDLFNVVNNPAAFAPVKLEFKSTTIGSCTNNGEEARLKVHQVAVTDPDKYNELVYSTEIVEATYGNGNSCPNSIGISCPEPPMPMPME
jgi:hypothetical protein